MTVTYENDDFFQNCVFRADQHIGVYTLGESEELSEGDLPRFDRRIHRFRGRER